MLLWLTPLTAASHCCTHLPPSLTHSHQSLLRRPHLPSSTDYPRAFHSTTSFHFTSPNVTPAPSAMDLLSGPAGNGMPLHCNICPKKPDFSDTSHLLTHVSSKQHLSNEFKMKLRASADVNARREIEAYERWYNEWSLSELLNERMSQKEKRGRSNGGGGGGTARRGSGGER